MNHNSIIRLIETKAWLINRQSASAYAALLAINLNGGQVSLSGATAKSPYKCDSMPILSEGPDDITDGSDEHYRTQSVMVYPVHGPIMKHTPECAESLGLLDIQNAMMQADADPSVSAHVFDIESGGGEARFMNTFAGFVRNQIQKPVLASFNGCCASAAYYFAAACDEVYAGENTDIVGSIGAMLTLADTREMLESAGIKIHEIYASQSSEKNKVINDALDGDYEPVQNELLNPFAIDFITAVKAFRPQIKDDKKVFKGAEYNAAHALDIGLIDGIMTLEMVIARAAHLGAEHQSTIRSQQKKSTEMSFVTNILASLKGDVKAEDVKAGVELAQAMDSLTALNQTLNAQVTQLTADLEAAKAELTIAVPATVLAEKEAQIVQLEADLEAEKATFKASKLGLPIPTPKQGERVVSEKLVTASSALAAAFDN